MIYRKAFQSGELGYASALSVVLFVIVLVISAFQLRMFDRLTTE
jgi:ABC-type sugar transport system permease subunit